MEAVYSDYSPNFLYVDKYRFSEHWVYPQTRVPYSLVRYIVSGSAIFTLDNIDYHVCKDDVFYIPQGSLLACTGLEELVFISIRFVGSIKLQGADVLTMLWNIPRKCSFAGNSEIYKWFEETNRAARSQNNYRMLEVRGYLNLILAGLAASILENVTCDISKLENQSGNTTDLEATFDVASLQKRALKSAVNSDPRITVITDYLISHPDENLSREEMSRLVDVSESTLRRLFKDFTGKTIHEFVKEVKMTNAARRLLVSNESVADIAYSLGFESPGYFSKCFREVFGVSPQNYRHMSHDT